MRTLLAAAALSAVVAAPAQADSRYVAPSGEDHRPCVSASEFNSYQSFKRSLGHDASRSELEAHWEVEGLGVPGDLVFLGRGVIYQKCGFSLNEKWYGVAYRRGSVWAFEWSPNYPTAP